MGSLDIIKFMDSHLGRKIKIITESGELLVNLLKDQNPGDETYNIKVIEGDVTDIEFLGGKETIHIEEIIDVQEAE